MLRKIQICLCFCFVSGILYEISLLSSCVFSYLPMAQQYLTPEQVLNLGKSIIFLETTERLEPPPLVSCSVESAARIYQDRPIILFLRGLTNETALDMNTSYAAFSLLSAMKNVFIFPLQMETVFQETPLLQWYNQVSARASGKQERSHKKAWGKALKGMRNAGMCESSDFHCFGWEQIHFGRILLCIHLSVYGIHDRRFPPYLENRIFFGKGNIDKNKLQTCFEKTALIIFPNRSWLNKMCCLST